MVTKFQDNIVDLRPARTNCVPRPAPIHDRSIFPTPQRTDIGATVARWRAHEAEQAALPRCQPDEGSFFKGMMIASAAALCMWTAAGVLGAWMAGLL